MIELPKDTDWRMVHGVPYLGVPGQPICVILHHHRSLSFARVFDAGEQRQNSVEESAPYTPEHFAAAKKLLDDYLAKKREESVKEVFRSEHITVFRRDDGAESFASRLLDKHGWDWWSYPGRGYGGDRDRAESDARQVLTKEPSEWDDTPAGSPRPTHDRHKLGGLE